jgi:hypothetical protein
MPNTTVYRPDVALMAVTSQLLRPAGAVGEVLISSHHCRLLGRARPLRGEVVAASLGDGDGVFVPDT